MRKKGALLILLLLLVAGFVFSGLGDYLSLSGLQALHSDILDKQAAQPWLFALQS